MESEGKESSLFDAQSYVNQPELEIAWAEKAVGHMETHFNLISSIVASQLKLCPYDDEIHEAFLSSFPNFKLDVLDIEHLKSEDSKKEWRKFCEIFKEKVDDATFGTLVRIDCSGEYNEENTILVLRIQFLAIEIARNRLGLNDKHCSKNTKKLDDKV